LAGPPPGGAIITSVSSRGGCPAAGGVDGAAGCSGTTATTTCSEVTGARPSMCWTTRNSCWPALSGGSWAITTHSPR
jgi:hypothetical protein